MTTRWWRKVRLPRLRLPRMRLRTKASLLFACIALVAGVSVAVATYTIARSSLLDQRASEAKAAGVVNARQVGFQFGRSQGELTVFVQELAEPDGFIQVLRDDAVYAASRAEFSDPLTFPVDLREVVAAGEAGVQRFHYGGQPYVGVGVYLASSGAQYFEAFSLQSTARTLQNILIAYIAGATVAVALFGAIGVVTGRRLLRPLGRVTSAAEAIADGDLAQRVEVPADPDLAPLGTAFNGMADAVQMRIERESRFASDVSHELRTPVTALQAAADILERRREEFSGTSRQAVDVVIDQVRRFRSMVIDLLELARIDAVAADLQLDPVDLPALCKLIATHHDLPDLPVQVVVGAPTAMELDRVRFERILGNLLANATIHAGGPTLLVIEPDREGDPTMVEVVVEDAGPGVDPDERDLVFGRFARGRESRHRVGTGLGLALVAEHAAALGGSAWAEDRPGGGSRFVVRLRAVPA